MKKIMYFFAICMVGVIPLLGCGSTPKVKNVSGTTEILEHKGSRYGQPIPSWVTVALNTPNQEVLKKELGIDKHIFVFEKTGNNLDFLQDWVNKVDARAGIVASIKEVTASATHTQSKDESSEIIDKGAKNISQSATLEGLAGLNKETEWWMKTRNRSDKNSDYIISYNYIVIYSLDEKLYQKHIIKANNELENYTDEEKAEYIRKVNELTEIKSME